MTISINNGTVTEFSETLSAADGYFLPSSVSVTEATVSYSGSTGLLTLTSIGSSVDISAAATTLHIGNQTLQKIYFGNYDVSKIYLGQTLLYKKTTPDFALLVSDGSYLKTSDDDYLTTKDPSTLYEIGFRGMVGSQTSLTRTGEAVGATWTATSGVISIDGINLSKIWGGYVGNDGEELTWDPSTLKYMNGSSVYAGGVFSKLNRFFIKPIYDSNDKLDGFNLCFSDERPSSDYQDWFLGKDHCIIGCYKARGETNGGFSGGLQSKQGLTYTSSCSANDIVAAYKLNSSSAYSLHEKWYNENAILQVLFMAIFATKQTADVFPEATYRHYLNDTRATGYMDSYRAQSLFAYEPAGGSGNRGNMFLGIEDFIGWGYELVAGVVLDGVFVCPTTDYANFDYSNTYYIDLHLSSNTGYITELQESAVNPGLLVPKRTTGGSATTYFCDYQYHGGTTWYQGASSLGTGSGVFYLYGWFGASNSNAAFAARLCGIPL